jgi:ribosomal protein L37AE/L43A
MFLCPVCGNKTAGRVAQEQYYCWDCCVEFTMKGDEVSSIYNVEADGSLSNFEHHT